jgi:hypothetical protein
MAIKDGCFFGKRSSLLHRINTFDSILYKDVSMPVFEKKTIDTSFWFQSREHEHLLNHQIMRLNSIDYKSPDAFDSFLKVRHDLFHSLVCKKFGLAFKHEAATDFKEFGIRTTKTPDFFYCSKDKKVALIGDMSVSLNPLTSKIEKMSKYKHIVDQLKDKTVKHPFVFSFSRM